MKIRINYDKVKFRIRDSGKIKTFLIKVIRKENKIPGDLVFIFTGDRDILRINWEFLGHNYYTDVITFNYSKKEVINGEIYIGIETVKRNAGLFKVPQTEEVLRVMIHGLLHLLGYNDGTEEERKIMTVTQEDLIKVYREEKNGL